MSNEQSVDMGSVSADVEPDLYYAVFQALAVEAENTTDSATEEFTAEIRIAERIQVQAGPEPSYAIVNIPLDQAGGDENAFSVALQRGGIAERIKPRMRATIVHSRNGSANPILAGSVVDVVHNIGDDSLVLTIFDDRWLLDKVTIFGQIQCDPARKKVGFVATEPCIFNMFGYPNCIDAEVERSDGSKAGVGPRFAPYPRYGWKSTDVKEPARGKAKTRARSWYVSDVIEYLRYAHYGRTDSLPPSSATSFGHRLVGDSIRWPAGVGGALRVPDEDGQANERLVHNLVLQGMTLGLALERVARTAGPFHLIMIPGAVGSGDNGNDVEAALLAAGDTFYSSLKAAVDGIMSGMQQAWDAGYETFAQFFRNSNASLHKLFDTYEQNMLRKMPEVRHLYDVEYRAMYAAWQAATPANYKKEAAAALRRHFQVMGMIVTGNAAAFAQEMAASLRGLADVQNQGAPSATKRGPLDEDWLTFDGGSVPSIKELTLQGMQYGTSTVAFISMRPRGGGRPLYVPGISGADIDSAMQNNGAQNGFIRESIINYYDDVCIVGDPVVIELMFSMASSGLGASGLEPAWSDADEQQFKDYIGDNGSDRDAFLEATRIWPNVYCAYRVKETFDITLGTKWAHKKGLMFRRNPKIRPTLVTGINMDEANPRDWLPRQIVIETEVSTADWRPCALYDGLTVSLDGSYFMVPALRDHPTKHPTWSGDLATPSGLTAENIRATLAVECDWPVSGWAGGFFDPNKSYRRVHQSEGHQQFTYLALAAPMDYVEWLRHQDARPAGSQVNGAVISGRKIQFPARATDAHPELFSDKPGPTGNPSAGGRIMRHVLARLSDVKRIEGTGQIVFKQLEPGAFPGAVIDGVLDSGFPISAKVVRSVTIEANSQSMIVEMG